MDEYSWPVCGSKMEDWGMTLECKTCDLDIPKDVLDDMVMEGY